MSSSFQIAIDGPVAAGCSTVARLVAKRLNFLYVDTGAMYRMVALLALRHEVDPKNEEALVKLVKNSTMSLRNPTAKEQDGRLITVLLDGKDVSWSIRTEKINKIVPTIASHSAVRKILVKKQQKIAEKHDVVMEGRDITYRVLPEADIKIYLTASDVIRAKRRHLQKQSKGLDVNFEEIYQGLLERDKQDKGRAIDPLKIVEDAWVIDTSDLSINQVVDLVEAKVKAIQDSRQN